MKLLLGYILALYLATTNADLIGRVVAQTIDYLTTNVQTLVR